MPIDKPEASAAPTTRRAFLTRAAIGGAVVTAGAVAGPFGAFAPAAGAQESGEGGGGGGSAASIDDATLLAFAGPLELAAVLAYQEALDTEVLDDDWTDLARQFQANHQEAADGLLANAAEATEPPVPDQQLIQNVVNPLRAQTDADGVLRALAGLEDQLAATHLSALARIPDPVSAKIVAQVLAVESQQAVLLGRAAGTPLEELTPAVADTDGARQPDTASSGGTDGTGSEGSGTDGADSEGTTTGGSEGGSTGGGSEDPGAQDAESEGPGASAGSEGGESEAGTDTDTSN